MIRIPEHVRTWPLVLALAAGALTAQDDPPADDYDPNFAAPRVFVNGMEVRSPADIRLTDVRLVGLEEEGNDFRARTPIFIGADTTPKLVDPDEAYARRLALYAAPEVEMAPVADLERRPAARQQGAAEQLARTAWWQWALSALAVLTAALWLRLRNRRAALAEALHREQRRRRRNR